MKNYFEKLVRANFRFGRMCKTVSVNCKTHIEIERKNTHVRI